MKMNPQQIKPPEYVIFEGVNDLENSVSNPNRDGELTTIDLKEISRDYNIGYETGFSDGILTGIVGSMSLGAAIFLAFLGTKLYKRLKRPEYLIDTRFKKIK